MPSRTPDRIYDFGPFWLELWRTGWNGRSKYAFRFFDREWSRKPLFERLDFQTAEFALLDVAALDALFFLSVRPEDLVQLDPTSYFKDYTPDQLKWLEQRAGLLREVITQEAERVGVDLEKRWEEELEEVEEEEEPDHELVMGDFTIKVWEIEGRGEHRTWLRYVLTDDRWEKNPIFTGREFSMHAATAYEDGASHRPPPSSRSHH